MENISSPLRLDEFSAPQQKQLFVEKCPEYVSNLSWTDETQEFSHFLFMALKKTKKKEEGSKRMRFLFFGVSKVAQSGLEKPI